MKTYVLLILVLASSASAQECININPIVQQVETSFPAFKPSLPALKTGLEEVNGTLKFDYPISDILAGVLYAAKSGIQANEMTIPAKEFERLLSAGMKTGGSADKGLAVAQDLVLSVVRNAEKVEIKRKKGLNQSSSTELIFYTTGGKAINIPTADISKGLAGQNVSINKFTIQNGSKIIFRDLNTLNTAQKEIYGMVYTDGDPKKDLKGWFIDKGMAAALPNYLNSAYAPNSKVHPAVIELSDIDLDIKLPIEAVTATPREMAILPGIQGTPGVVLGMRAFGTYIPLTFEGKASIDDKAQLVGQKIQRPELAVNKQQLDKYRKLFSNALKNGKACGPDIQREEPGTPAGSAESN
ncbi:hypothetical protein K2X30_08225 [bacterium]|nr:hypothetical protein [bacterium]